MTKLPDSGPPGLELKIPSGVELQIESGVVQSDMGKQVNTHIFHTV